MIKNRIIEIDIIKTIAILGVVLIHACAPGVYAYNIGSLKWNFIIFIGSMIRASVPLFFMASGALMLDKNKTIKISDIYSKYLIRLIAALFFWAISYEIFNMSGLIIRGELTLEIIKEVTKRIFLFQHHPQLYFLHIMIIFYMFLPIMKSFTENSSKKYLEYALILWFLLGILYPFLRNFKPFSLMNGIPSQYAINMTYSSIGFGILGHYIRKYIHEINIYSVFLILFGLAFTYLGTLIMSIRAGENILIFWEGMSPGVCILAIGIYTYIFKNTNYEKEYKFAIELSKSSFAIFLVHDFFNIIFNRIGFTIDNYNPIFFISLSLILITLLSYTIYKILNKIPIINKYLI